MKDQKRVIRVWLVLFIISLLLSGVTAFAVETELRWLLHAWDRQDTALYHWIRDTYTAISTTNRAFPALAYGYDWLAFAHIAIAVVFIGPLMDPVRNIWVIRFGCIACIMIFPLAFIAGSIRHIPFFWQLIDCSFGIIGLFPLILCYSKARKLERYEIALRNHIISLQNA